MEVVRKASMNNEDFNTNLMELNYKQFCQDIQDLCEINSLEIQLIGKDIFIPYMLNDAVESYYWLKDCTVQGDTNFEPFLSINPVFHKHEGKLGFSINNQPENQHLATVWFSDYEKCTELYQYHRIGHFWRKGQERWRRFVYILGTIYDKNMYLGEEKCNVQEIELIKLMEFSPFRYWNPINQPIYENISFQEPDIGIEAAKKMAKEAKDQKLYEKICKYEKHNTNCRKKKWNDWVMAHHLTKANAFADYLDEKIEEASLLYSERSFSDEENQKMALQREQCVKKYREKGYKGTYPVMYKNNKKIEFFEEHPYKLRMFEYNSFKYRISGSIVSENLK